jgi:PAS domain S-box-containing protein
MKAAVSRMQTSRPGPEEMIAVAVQAAQAGAGDALAAVLDAMPAAIYVTDREGVITHFNRACVALAGRTPTAGQDRWCVTWRIYTVEGEALPHDRCPMAVAIREGRELRGQEAVAERPDGTRVRFTPYPTPLFDANGELVGAVNLLVDVTERRRLDYLREQARRCRRLAASVDHGATAATLSEMADEYEAQAAQLGGAH